MILLISETFFARLLKGILDHPSRSALHKFPSGIDVCANNAFFYLQALDLYCYGSVVFNVAADFVCFVAYSPLLMFFFLCLFVFYRNKGSTSSGWKMSAWQQIWSWNSHVFLPWCAITGGAKILQEILDVISRSLSYLLLFASADNSCLLTEVQCE